MKCFVDSYMNSISMVDQDDSVYWDFMHLSMLSCWGGGGGERPGIGGGFELRSVFLFKCVAPGKSSWVKKVQIPHPRSISQKCIGKKEQKK